MRYREVIRLPWWTYAVFAGLAGLLMFTFAAVVGVPTALVIFFIVLVVGWVFIWRRATLISVDDEFLRVGSQSLALQEIGNVTPLDAGRCGRWPDRMRTPGRTWSCAISRPRQA